MFPLGFWRGSIAIRYASYHFQNRSVPTPSCILQRGNLSSASDSIGKIALKKWKNIVDQSKKWTGRDTFESVFRTADWKLGPAALFMYDSCYIKLCSARKLVQVEKRKEKQS